MNLGIHDAQRGRVLCREDERGRDTPSRKSLPQVLNQGKFAGRQVWSFDFDYIPPAHVLVDPTCVRIMVDDASGEVAFFTPW